jgi:purine-nucleoside phosphorylase
MSRNIIEQARNQRVEAASFIKERLPIEPEYLLILGTGLGQLAEEMTVELELPYEEIPHFPVSTVESHAGKLLMGNLGGKSVMAMQGRFHYYEGYSMNQIVFPVRVAKMLGIQTLLVSNACGGLNPNYERGDIMLINDHINFLGDNPLIGPNDPNLGPRFPDMSQPYTERLLSTAEQVALDAGIKIHQGVYLAVSGPMLETKAEYRYMRQLGADVVGMSTVPEVIAAIHMSMEVLGISVITDECFPDSLEPVSLDDVLEAAAMAEPHLTRIVVGVLERL